MINNLLRLNVFSVQQPAQAHAPRSTQTNTQKFRQSQQAQFKPSEIEISYDAVTTHQQQEQPSQLHESQFIPHAQDQILPQPRRSPTPFWVFSKLTHQQLPEEFSLVSKSE